MEKDKGLFSFRKHPVGNFLDGKKGRKRKGGRLRRSMGFLMAAALIFNTLPASGLAVSASEQEKGLCEHHPEHTADCGYMEAQDCGYVCKICNGTEPEDVENNAENDTEDAGTDTAECICETLCTEDSINGDCPVCGAEDAGLSRCKGEKTEEQDKTGEKVITAWEWIDPEEYLTDGMLALPGAGRENPAFVEDVTALLPEKIQAKVAVVNAKEDGEETEEDAEAAPVTEDMEITLAGWECASYPEDGAYEGVYTFRAFLPEGFVLAEGVAVLEVKVELGGAEMLLRGKVSAAYQKAAWDESKREVVCTEETADSCTPVENSAGAVTWYDGWYVVDSSVIISEPITVIGAVNLILADGCTLTAQKGIVVTTDNSLAIYAQSGGTGTLNATSAVDGDNAGAGIGGSTASVDSGTITIHGGVINATSGEGRYSGAGIGGGGNINGNGGTGNDITICGGNVTAVSCTSEGGSAGIGGGAGGYGGGAGKITIRGGTVRATGGLRGAGIGGGSGAMNKASGNGTATISGGTVIAVGGKYAAGIGGGGYSTQYINNSGGTGNVTISGGIVDAKGGEGNSSGNYVGDPIGNGGNTTASATVSKTGGIVFENGAGTVCGVVTLDGRYTVPAGYTLNIPASASLSGSGTLSGGGTFTTENLTADMISVPTNLYYDGKDRTEDITSKLSAELTKGVELCGKTFTVSGWTLAVTKTGDLAYTATYTNNSDNTNTFTKSITLQKSGTDLTSEGKVLAYNGDTQTTAFNADDTITVKAAPTATGAAPQKAAARLRVDPAAGQMAVFVGDTQVSEPVGAVDGSYTMEVLASDVLMLDGVEPNGNAVTLTAKFVGNDNMADAAGTVDVNISAVAVAERDGTVIAYYGESNLADAFGESNNDATITLLDNVTTSTQITVNTDNLTLDLNGKTYTHINNTAFNVPSYNCSLTIRGSGEVTTSGSYCLTMYDGTLNIESGSFSAKDSAVYTVGGTLQLTGGSFTGGKYAIAFDSGEVMEALANYGGTDASHYAFYQGSSPYAPSGNSLPSGTFTVEECQHTGVEVTNLGDGKHGMACPYCGYHYEHATTLTATASGNNVTLYGGCSTEGCGYQTPLGTASFTFPKVTYGQSGDVTCTWDGSTGYYVKIEITNGGQYQIEKNGDEEVTKTSLSLADLFGSTKVTAGGHKLKVSFFSDAAVSSNECELNFTIDPALLTDSMVTLSAESLTYNGTEQKPTLTVKHGGTTLIEGTDYEVICTRDGVVTNDFTSAGTVKITITGQGNYGGKVEKTFTIEQAESDVGTVTAETLENTLDVSRVVLSRTNQTLAGTLMLTDSALKYGTNTYTWKFTPDNTNYKTVTGEVEVTVGDTIVPTGKISIGTNKWSSFLNTITFGLFFKKTEQVTITAQDNESGVASVSYYISENGLTEEEVETLDNWTAGNTDKTTFNISQKESCVVYAKITDNQGNMAYISSDGLLFDGTSPSITGVTDGETYCTSQTVTVTDNNLESVTVNGKEQALSDGKFTLGMKFDTTPIVIAATDKAGNVTTVTVNAGHHYGTEWKSDSNGHWQECVVCGNVSEVSAHTEDSGTVTKPATQTETGIRIYKCSVCGYKMRTEEIAKLPPDHTHSYGMEWKSDNSNHWHECNCGAKSDSAAHSEDSGTVTKPAAETETGIRIYKCSVCGYKMRTEEIAKLPSNTGGSTGGGSGSAGGSTGGGSGSTGGGSGSTGGGSGSTGGSTDTKQPFIKDSSGREGWDVIRAEMETAAAAPAGGTVAVDMNGAASVPGSIFAAVRGKDVTLSFDMGSGVTWTVNGKGVTAETAGDTDFSVTAGAGAIPKELLAETAGGLAHLEISLAHEGAFGFTATLTLRVAGRDGNGTAIGSSGTAAEYTGMYANLFYYNPSLRSLEFVCAGQIREDGTADLPFMHASDYTVILSADPMGGTGTPQEPENPQQPAAQAKVKSVKLSKTLYTYDGKLKKPAVLAVDTEGRRISARYYTVRYKNNRKAGRAAAVVTFKGGYEGTVKKAFTIRPVGTSIRKLAAAAGGFTVNWKKKAVQTGGYQIQYSANAGFQGSSTHSVFVKKNTAVKKTVKNLKAGKKYYVRIRTYQTVTEDGKNIRIYSAWSRAARVNTPPVSRKKTD